MSWTISISPVPRDDFTAVIDAAEAGGQDASLPGVADDIAAAKAAMKYLAKQVKRPLVGGQASGHTLQESEGDTWADSLSASVYGMPEPATS